MRNPAVVDASQPNLGWVNLTDPQERGQYQTAWQIKVASDSAGLSNPDLWDSGIVPSGECLGGFSL